ncbi:MAG TPA: hypothetical protein VEK07_23525 [Polyangiaceae bacterium]|nr:hypothetical protein [Polyangiaceae bacterium]
MRLAAFAMLAGFGCSTTPSDVLQLVPARGADGGSIDPLTQPPQVGTLVVQEIDDVDGDVQLLADATLSAAPIDLAIQPGGITHTITVTGYDAEGGAVAFGATLPFQAGALSPATTPGVFVQRTEQMAVMPGALSEPRPLPLFGLLNGQTLFVSGGDTSSDLYSLTWYATQESPSLPFVPRSIAIPPCAAPNVATPTCGVAWLFGSSDGLAPGYYIDFGTDPPAASAFTLPGPGSFADIAGGVTVTDGVHLYIVGGTGTSGPAQYTLAIDPSDTSDDSYPYGYPSWSGPYTARQGASAVWAGDYGLVMLGGTSISAGEDAGAVTGIEQILGFLTSICSAGQSPPSISVTGAGAALLPTGDQVLLAGGLTGDGQDAGVMLVDLTACTITPWSSLPAALANAQVFVVDALDAVVVGNEAAPSFRTHVFRVNPAGAVEIPTVVPHANATAVSLPMNAVDPGSFLLFGGLDGGSTWLESFVPSPPL